MHESFYAFIQGLSPEFKIDINLLKSLLNSRKVSKGEFLFHRGDICDFVAFTYKGCLRSFVLKDGKEYTLFFHTENQTFGDYESFEKDGYYAKVVQTFLREDNTIQELFQNPSLISFPKKIRNQLEYSFPSTTLFKVEIPLGEILQFFILYPETENQTRTFVLLYANWQNPIINLPGLVNLIQRSLLESTAKIVKQASTALDSIYPSQKPKIRLPKEAIMSYVEKLYDEW